MAAQAAQDLFLVAGSARKSIHQFMGKIPDQVQNAANCDLSHKSTFDGKATTMDLETCIAGDAHIVGDVRKFDFSPYNIRAVYLERLPTVDPAATAPSEAGDIIGDTVKNLAKFMSSGAKMTIEWHPFGRILGLPFAENRRLIRENPFTGFYNSNTMAHGFFIGCDIMDMPAVESTGFFNPEEMHEIVSDAEKIKEILRFIAETAKINIEDLKGRIKQEMFIFQKFCQCSFQKAAVLAYGPDESIENFDRSMEEGVIFAPYKQEDVGKKQTVVLRKEKEAFAQIRTIYDANLFITSAFFNYVLAHLTARKNLELVRSFMERNGFKDIEIQCKKSPYNNRKNVWLIEAIRNGELTQTS